MPFSIVSVIREKVDFDEKLLKKSPLSSDDWSMRVVGVVVFIYNLWTTNIYGYIYADSHDTSFVLLLFWSNWM